MFTGIVEETGRIRQIRRAAKSVELEIAGRLVLEGSRPGDSIAVNGICLTVTRLGADWFSADAMPETLERSSLGSLAAGSRVNLERALRLSDRLGGHLVSGHVDGVGRIMRIRQNEIAWEYRVGLDAGLLRYVALKGSVALDGISLTVSALGKEFFEVSVIPHTIQATNLSDKREGSVINVECDMIAKHLERLLSGQQGTARGLDIAFLAEHGFLEE